MAKVILQISYEIEPDRREEYDQLAREMKQHFTLVRKKNYAIYEQKGKKNAFVEQFVCESQEEYEALEDDLDEKSEDMVNRLETLLKEGKSRYITLIESE